MPELKGGESYVMSLAPLRVTLAGVAEGVVLRILEGDKLAQVAWVSPTEAVILTQPRVLSLRVEGADGGLIPPGTTVGLGIRADLAGDPEQVVVSPSDVGAKRSVEFANLTITSDGVTVKVPERASEPIAGQGRGDWSRPGAYAFREAFVSAVPASSLPWVFAVDGSVSMARRLEQESMREVVRLVAGIGQEWMRRSPKGVLRTTPWSPSPVTAGPTYADDVIAAIRDSEALASWLHLAPVVRNAGAVLGSGGSLLAVLSGVPSDIPEVMAALDEFPRLDLRLVVWGRSVLGLPAAPRPEWFADDLALLSSLSARATVIAVDDDPALVRSVELAAALAAEEPARYAG
ncbi:hypothetical protein ASE01_12135 [Nocardioides sp. Root190]|uniref:hypothetical protein n=1 Tax=Nocardioides sp. Root190 TaxID=1736488 RepID=UPI0006F63B8E|nr:hypothetical protein [Nocardioides sp. Root190]KRB75804.1 hypothetical protein ASE01_12135 [Nocardioides sp. Root190]